MPHTGEYGRGVFKGTTASKVKHDVTKSVTTMDGAKMRKGGSNRTPKSGQINV